MKKLLLVIAAIASLTASADVIDRLSCAELAALKVRNMAAQNSHEQAFIELLSDPKTDPKQRKYYLEGLSMLLDFRKDIVAQAVRINKKCNFK